MIYTRNEKGEFLKDGHTMFPADILTDLKRMAYLEALNAERKELITCDIDSLDFEQNYVQFVVPQGIMDKGFHAGAARIDFSGVQD